MKPAHPFHFLASSIAALTVAHTASGIGYDANTTINTVVTSSDGVKVGVTNPNVTLSTATVNTVTLGSDSARLNLDNGRLIARADGTLVSGTGSIVLNGTGYISTDFAGSTISTGIGGSGTLVKEGTQTGPINGVVFTVTPIPNSIYQNITAEIPLAAASGAGRLFARLQATP